MIFKDLENRERIARLQQIGEYSQMIQAKDMLRQMELQEVLKSELENKIDSYHLVRQEGNRLQLQKTLRMDWFIYACATLILPLSCIMASMGKIDLYDTIFIVQLAGNIIWSTQSLGIAMIEFNKKRIGAKAIEEMMKKPEDVNLQGNQVKPVTTLSNDLMLEFQKVSIKYQDYEPIHDLSFQCKKGTITLIMGPSGIGKSSIINAVLGFADHTGRVKVGDEILTKDNRRKIRASVSYVSEHCELEDETIGDNMKLANDEISEDKMLDLFQTFQLSNLGEGREENILDIHCGTKGENLSGGQKQRLSIVRAMIKDSDLMLLDEPTAHLDGDTEELVLRELCNLRNQGKTILMVSHRESSMKIADQIVYL